MDDLGLGQLADDALLQLLEAVCNEFAVRDPFVRDFAAMAIKAIGDRIVMQREACEAAIETVRRETREGYRREALAEVRTRVRLGTMRCMSPAQEERALSDGIYAAKMETVSHAIRVIEIGRHREESIEAIKQQRFRGRAIDENEARAQYERQLRTEHLRVTPSTPFVKRAWKP